MLSKLFYTIMTVCLAAALTYGQGSTAGTWRPEGPWNGMQIKYSVTGVNVTSTEEGGPFCCWIRTLKGDLPVSGTIRVTGSVGMVGGLSAGAVVSVRSGNASKEWRGEVDPKNKPWVSFDVSIVIPPGATSASISISMEGRYGSAAAGESRGVSVVGTFSRPAAVIPPEPAATPGPTPKPAATPPKLPDKLQKTLNELEKQIHRFDNTCFGSAISLGDVGKFRKALDPSTVEIYDGTLWAQFGIWARGSNAFTKDSPGFFEGNEGPNAMYLPFSIPIVKNADKNRGTLWHETYHHIEQRLYGDRRTDNFKKYGLYRERNGAYLDAAIGHLQNLQDVETGMKGSGDNKDENAYDEMKAIAKKFDDLETGEATRELIRHSPQLWKAGDPEKWPPDFPQLKYYAGIDINFEKILDKYASGVCGDGLKDLANRYRAEKKGTSLSIDNTSSTTSKAKEMDDLLKQGAAFAVEKKYAEALTTFNKALSIAPNNADALRQRAVAKRELKDLPSALEDFNSSIRLDPKNERAYVGRGITKERMKDVAGALGDYDLAIAMNRKYVNGYFYRGLLKLNQKDYQSATADFDRVIELEPANSGAHNNRGLARAGAGNTDGAIADYEKAIALNPNDEIAKKNLAAIRPATKPDGVEHEIFSTGNDYGVANGGTAPSFVVKSAVTLTQIMTYHWNQGRGAPGGTIALRDAHGKVFGPWNVSVRAKVYWEVNQQIKLPPGTYTVIDSDPSTWAQNAQTGGKGMVVIKGIN